MPTDGDASDAASTDRARRLRTFRRGSGSVGRRSVVAVMTCLALAMAQVMSADTALVKRSAVEGSGRGVTQQSTVEVVYCAGWDPRVHEPAGVIGPDEARKRDSAGQPYAVLLSVGARPRALLQIDWARHYLGLFLFDAHGRRDRAYDYRELEPGLLYLHQYEQRRYRSADEPEFPERGWRLTITTWPDGDAAGVELDHDGLFQTQHDIPEPYRTRHRAAFGDWMAYASGRMLGLDPRVAGADGVTLVPAQPWEHQRSPQPSTPLWRAPSGTRPRHLPALFTPGSRFAEPGFDTGVVTEPEPAGMLRLPTGAVIAADPATLDSRDEPFTVTVPAGNYPVLIAGIRWEREGWDEATAAMLKIHDKSTTSWELAVRPGQDIRMLGDGEFYGFGVDTGTGAFLDASGRDALAAAYQAWHLGDAENDDPNTQLDDPRTGTNLITYPSGRGDGSYPVWIGRTADGDVTCLVADMLTVHHMKPLPPTAPDTAAFLTPTPARNRAGSGPAPADPEATAAFLATVAASTAAMKNRVSRR